MLPHHHHAHHDDHLSLSALMTGDGRGAGSGLGSPAASTSTGQDDLGSLDDLAGDDEIRADSPGHSPPDDLAVPGPARLHARNLSVFFPHPGQPADRSPSPPARPDRSLPVQSVPTATRVVGSGDDASGACQQSRRQVRSRRGHHHRHSLSHNFFPFLGEVGSSLAAAALSSPPSTVCANRLPRAGPAHPPGTPLSAIPKPVPQQVQSLNGLPSSNSIVHARYAHLPSPLRLLVGLAVYTNRATKAKLVLALANAFVGLLICLGASGRLSLVGLGYLLVFDAFGLVSELFLSFDVHHHNDTSRDPLEKVWDVVSVNPTAARIRFPFGRSRIKPLVHLSQAIYLSFSGIYILKEAIEKCLVSDSLGSDSSHSHLHGHHHASDQPGIPTVVVWASLVLAVTSSVAFKNHSPLKALVFPHLDLNPFGMMSVGFASLILVAFSLAASDVQFQRFDKILSFLQLICVFKLSVPVARMTGKVLLQTLPTDQLKAVQRIRQANDRIKQLRLGKSGIKSVEQVKVWQLGPRGDQLIATLIAYVDPDRLGKNEEQLISLTQSLRDCFRHDFIGELTVDLRSGPPLKPASAHGDCSHHHHSHPHEEHHSESSHTHPHRHRRSHSRSHTHSIDSHKQHAHLHSDPGCHSEKAHHGLEVTTDEPIHH